MKMGRWHFWEKRLKIKKGTKTMNRIAPIFLTCLLVISLVVSCGRREGIQTLDVEQGKAFAGLSFKKVFQIDLYGGWCLALPRGFICSELLDRSYKESQIRLYDDSGKLIRERRLIHGDGPDEVRVWNFNNVWLSSSGKILSEDNNYLKSLDPETLEIKTICKLSNVIEGYGSKYTLGWHSFTSLEENDGRIVTSFESPAFFQDMTYYIVTSDAGFKNLSVLAKAKKPKPLVWAKLEERKKNNGKLESITDYYHLSRMTRTLSADWKRRIIYFFSDIEEPVIESVDFQGKNRKEYLIDLNLEGFKAEREEFDFYHEYAASETDPRLKGRFTDTLYIPPHAPALMGIKVWGDRLFVITGKRDWKRKENEVLAFGLPSMKYEGSFFIPYPNLLQIQWYDNHYITRTLVKKDGDYYSSYKIYRVENDDLIEGLSRQP
jgi:hypothetical protein